VPAIGIKPAGLLPVWTTFHQSFYREDVIFKRAARHEETSRIVAIHKRRKKDYMAIKHLLGAAHYSPVPAVKDAATLLLEVMENYKSANTAPMNEATALYMNLIQDFAKAGHAAAAALVPGVPEAVAQLNTDDEAFRTIYYARAQDEEDMKVEGTMQEARQATDQAFITLVKDINAMYCANEILGAAKDQEVSDALGKIIMDINAYLHLHEETYARRYPNYNAGKDKPSSPAEPAEPVEPVEPGIPEFSIDAQESIGNSTAMPGYGAQMTLRAVDAHAFADVLYPDAQDGVLQLTWPGSGNSTHFPVAAFLLDTDNATPIGIVVDAPEDWGIYKPFTATGEVLAEIIKDNQTLAILLNVQFPSMMGLG
jgi:hypothetical protein